MRPALLAAVIVVVVGFSLSRFLSIGDRLVEEQYAAIEAALDAEVIGNQATPLLKRVVDLVSIRHPEAARIDVNQIAGANRVSLILVDPALPEVEKTLGNLGTATRNNLLTVGRKYILIDKAFLTLLARQAYADFNMELQIEERRHARDPEWTAADERRSFNVSRMLRIGNLEKPIIEGEHAQHDEILGEYEKLASVDTTDAYIASLAPNDILSWGTGNDFAPLIALTLSRDPNANTFPFSDAIAVPLSAAFTPLLLHELGHIEAGDGGAFMDTLDGAIEDRLADQIQKSEEKADKFATDRIGMQLGQSAYTETFGGYAYDYPRGIYTAAKLLEDIAFIQKFFRFRDINTQSVGSLILYNNQLDCRRAERGFFDVNFIDDIIEIPMPVLTEDELEHFKTQFRNQESSTHPHLYARSLAFREFAHAQIPEFVEGQSTYQSLVRQQLTGDLSALDASQLAAAYRADLERLYPGRFQAGIDAQELESALASSGYDIQTTQNCPFERCSVYFDNDSSFMEIGYRGNKAVYFAFYTRILGPGWKNWDGAWSRDPVHNGRFERHMSVFLTIIRMFAQIETDMADFQEKSAWMLGNFMDCGFASLHHEGDAGLIMVGTTDFDTSAYMVFVSK